MAAPVSTGMALRRWSLERKRNRGWDLALASAWFLSGDKVQGRRCRQGQLESGKDLITMCIASATGQHVTRPMLIMPSDLSISAGETPSF